MKNKIIVALAILAFNVWEVAAQGCSQCKIIAAQQSSPTELDEAALASNVNYGIMYLMAFPYLMILFFYRKPVINYFKTKIFNKKPA